MLLEQLFKPMETTKDSINKVIHTRNLRRATVLFAAAAMGIEATTPIGYSTLTLAASVPTLIGFGAYYAKTSKKEARLSKLNDFVRTIAGAAATGSMLYYSVPEPSHQTLVLPFYLGSAIINGLNLEEITNSDIA